MSESDREHLLRILETARNLQIRTAGRDKSEFTVDSEISRSTLQSIAAIGDEADQLSEDVRRRYLSRREAVRLNRRMFSGIACFYRNNIGALFTGIISELPLFIQHVELILDEDAHTL